MKFTLYVLGALCFVQLAFVYADSASSSESDESDQYEEIAAAAGLTDDQEAKIQCIEDKLTEYSIASSNLSENLKGQCFNEANFTPETSAAVEIVKDNIASLKQAIVIFRRTRIRLQKFINLLRVGAHAHNVLKSVTDLLNTANVNGSTIKQCVKEQLAIVVVPLKQLRDCVKVTA